MVHVFSYSSMYSIIRPCIHPFINLFVHVFNYLSIYFFNRSFYPFILPNIYIFIHLSLSIIYIFFRLFNLFLHLFIRHFILNLSILFIQDLLTHSLFSQCILKLSFNIFWSHHFSVLLDRRRKLNKTPSWQLWIKFL